MCACPPRLGQRPGRCARSAQPRRAGGLHARRRRAALLPAAGAGALLRRAGRPEAPAGALDEFADVLRRPLAGVRRQRPAAAGGPHRRTRVPDGADRLCRQPAASAVEPAPPDVGAGSAPLFWAQIVGNAGLFAALVPITRALGPTGRGTVAFITVTAIVSATLARFGITEATTVFVAQRPRARPALLTNVMLFVTVPRSWPRPRRRAPCWRSRGCGRPAWADPSSRSSPSPCSRPACRCRLHVRAGLQPLSPPCAGHDGSAWLYASAITLTAVRRGSPSCAPGDLGAVQAIKALVLLAVSIRAEGLGTPLPLLLESARFGLGAWIGTLSAPSTTASTRSLSR